VSQYFNNTYYHDPEENRGDKKVRTSRLNMSVGDAMANLADYVVSFYHVPTGEEVYFKAYIVSFNETYASDWAAEPVYGRVDPIYMFKQTQRALNLAIKIPAETHSEAYENLGKVGKLSRFLYPAYTNVDDASTIAQSPLVRMKVMNLARQSPSTTTSEQDTTAADLYDAYGEENSVEAQGGLLGVISSLAVNHNLEGEDGVIFKKNRPNTILPKLIDINITFNAIHEKPLGWSKENTSWEFGGGQHSAFPYGVRLEDVKASTANEPLFSDLTGIVYATEDEKAAGELALQAQQAEAQASRVYGALSAYKDKMVAAADDAAAQYEADKEFRFDEVEEWYESEEEPIVSEGHEGWTSETWPFGAPQ